MKNKKEVISGIYAIKSKVDGKMYIGSAIDIFKRWSEHKNLLKLKLHNKRLQKSWELYGEKNFEFLILERVTNNLLEIEQFYLDNFKTYKIQIGYNVNQKAIRTNKKGRQVYQYDIHGNFLQEHKSVSEAARLVKIKPSGIVQSCNKNKLSSAGYIWRYYKVYKLKKEETIDSHWTTVLQYNLEGLFLKEWHCISIAAKQTNSNSDSIVGACIGRNKTAGGFIWKYKENNLSFKKCNIIDDYRKRAVIQYDLNENLIQEWDSATSAAKALGLNRKYISSICNKINKKEPKNYLWKWKMH